MDRRAGRRGRAILALALAAAAARGPGPAGAQEPGAGAGSGGPVPEAGNAADEAALAVARAASRASVAAARRVRPAVVNITTEQVTSGGPPGFGSLFDDEFFRMFRPNRPRRVTGQGSGVVVDPEGYILTNHHVIEGADAIAVNLLDGRTFKAELVGSDRDSDIAVVRIRAEGLVAAELADSDLLEVGETVLAVGNPFGLESTVTSGIVSARGRANLGILEREDFIQTDAAINPGNSGGALIDLDGRVVGINTAIFSRSGGYQGIGFAIPANIARAIWGSLVDHQRIVAADLGLQTQDLDAALAQAFGLAAPRGALVNAVRAGSPGARAGLRRGDVIVRFGAADIPDDRSFRNRVALAPPGQPVILSLVRGGEAMTAEVTPEAEPEVVEFERRAGSVLDLLGIQVEEITPVLADRHRLAPGAAGLVVTSVTRGNRLLRHSLWPGSVILKVDGAEVRGKEAFNEALARADLRKGMELQWQTQNRVFPPLLIRTR